MKDAWDVENALIPIELSMDVGRAAVVLYVYALSYADSSGFCDRIYLAAARAGLNRAEALGAVKELQKAGYIETSEIPDLYGTSTACKLLHHKAPLRHERLTSDVWRALKASVFQRDNFTYQYCLARGGSLECDHVEPISKGGTNELGNLITACAACNRNKRAKKLETWAGRSIQ